LIKVDTRKDTPKNIIQPRDPNKPAPAPVKRDAPKASSASDKPVATTGAGRIPAVTATRYGVVAITGGSSGLGAAIAAQIAGEAKTLLLIGRSKEKLQKLMAALNQKFPKVRIHPIVCDLTNAEHRKRLIGDLSKLKIDTLILNAGSGVFKKFLEAQYADHLRTIDLNITANVDLAYHLIPTLSPNARIQVISSHSSEMRIPNFSVYAPAKTFLTLWAQTLALELRNTGKTVSIICAGAMDTDFGPRAGIPKMVSKIATPSEIALKCVARLDRAGTHYLTAYDKLIWAMNRFLPRFLIDFLISKIQGRYLK
jgi:short-subunit dehydrogenase